MNCYDSTGFTRWLLRVIAVGALTLLVTAPAWAEGTAPGDKIPGEPECASCPKAICLPDTTIFVNDLTEICLSGFSCLLADSAFAIGGDYNDGTICFAPVEGENVIGLVCVDGGYGPDTCWTTVTVIVEGPIIRFGEDSLGFQDTTVYQCFADDICIPYTLLAEGAGDVTVTLESGPGTLDTDNQQICFLPTEAGEYCFVLRATDAAGNFDLDTACVTVVLNRDPFAVPPPEVMPVICLPGDSVVCTIGWEVGDPDGDSLVFSTMGSGTFDPETGTFCSPVGAAGQYTQTLVVSDTCGATVKITYTFDVKAPEPPQVTITVPDSALLCEPDTICADVEVVYENPDSLIVESNIGTLVDGRLCFNADTTGLYTLIVTAVGECEVTGADTATVAVTLNQEPSIEVPDPEDQTAFACEGDTLACLSAPVWVGDPDLGDSLSIEVSEGTTYDPESGTFCIQNPIPGEHEYVIEVTDRCGATVAETLHVAVTLGTPPTITFSTSDTTVYVCDPDTQLCFYVYADDGSGDTVIIREILNPGYFDPSTGQFCYNPASICFDYPECIDTTVCVVFEATGVCGTTVDSLCVTIVSVPPPVVIMPPDTTVLPCELTEVCVGPVVIESPGSSPLEIVGLGAEYRDGFLCFVPELEGSYYVSVQVSDTCGHVVTDSMRVDVYLNQPPVIEAPDTTFAAVCGEELVCVGPIVAGDPDGDPFTIHVIEGGGYIDTSSGNLCFVPEGTGYYRFVLAATDSCATTFDTVVVDLQANEPPAWVQVPEGDVRLCAPGDTLCFTVVAEDPDGDSLAYAIAVPGGEFQPFGGEYCFVPDTARDYRYVVRAADSCHAPIEDTVHIEVRFNTLPELIFSVPDTTIYICDPDTPVCFFVGGLDADGDSVVVREIRNPGAFDPETGEVCFNPGEICFGDPEILDTTICLIFGASDPCRTEVVDSVCFQFVRNRPPVVQLPPPGIMTLCRPGEACIDGAVITDPDGDSLSIELSSGAYLQDGALCFTAHTAGTYELWLCATDPCGEVTCDTTSVEVRLNAAPVVTFPGDVYRSLCTPGEVCIELPEVFDPDGDPLQITIEGARQVDDQLCFVALDAGTYTIVVAATDTCGVTGADTTQIFVMLNSPPRVLIRNAAPIRLCDIDTVLCYAVKVSDMDGADGITLRLIKSDPRVWSLQDNRLCIDAAEALASRTSGTFRAIVEAEDPCGAKGRDTFHIDLATNQAPFVSLPADEEIFLCDPGEVCLGPVTYGDPDGGTPDVQITGGILVGDSICTAIESDSAFWITLTVTDSCGASARDSMYVDVTLNQAPVLSLPDISELAVCSYENVCVDSIFGVDREQGLIAAKLTGGPGEFDPETGTLCFVPEQDGTHEFTFETDDGCVTVSDTWSVTVTANQPPVSDTSPDTAIFACEPGDTVCLQFDATDPDGDPLVYRLDQGPGQINPTTGRVCFVPEITGMYEFVVTAADTCGNAAVLTGYATIQFNRPPELHFSSNDTTLYLCDSDTLICFTVTATDPDGEAPPISEILNPGMFNPETGEFCFNPDSLCCLHPETVDTTICFIFAATDECDAQTIDSLCVQIIRNRAPVVDLGPDTSRFLCEPGDLCLDLTGRVYDPDGDDLQLSTDTPAFVSGDSLCIAIDTAGTYQIALCATDPCGLETCDTLVLEVELNLPPVVALPPDTTVVACSVSWVCVGPVTLYDPNPGDTLDIQISGGAELVDGKLCFAPAGDGVYDFVVTATDRCGEQARDSITVTINVNDPPLLIFSSPDTTLIVCNSDTEICFAVTATDPDGDSVIIEEVLVPGFYDPLTGGFCFNPDSICFGNPRAAIAASACQATEYGTRLTMCMIFRATDECGASTVDSLCVTVEPNLPPELIFSSADTTMFLCQPDTLLCFGVTATDPEGDSVIITEIKNPGAYFPEAGIFCFNPDSICFSGASYDTTFCVIFQATDACGNSRIDSLCLELFANHPPVVVAPDSVQKRLCALGDEVCVDPVYGEDVEDGILSVDVPGATYDPLLQSFCFNADTTGTYVFLATTVDSCGTEGREEITVEVALNLPPTVLLPPDTSLFLCGADTVCFDILISDPEDTAVISEISGPAYFDLLSGQLCVEINADTPLTVGVTVVDDCGALATDSFVIDAVFNSPPTVTLPEDFDTKACETGEFCFGPALVVDVDDNLAQIDVTGGRYDADSMRVCIDVVDPGTYTLILTATDSCGASGVDTVQIDVTLNSPPLTSFSVPDTALYLCHPDTTLCFFFAATDPDGDYVILDEILNPGMFDPLTGEFCFNPGDICFDSPYEIDTTVCLIFSATDECGATTYDTLCLELTANKPPVVVAPSDTSVTVCNSDSICLNPFEIYDPNDEKDTLQVTVTGPPHVFDSIAGVICFEASVGEYGFVVSATDRCGEMASDTVHVSVSANAPPVVSLPPDFGQLVCQDSALCFPADISDSNPDDELTVVVLPGPGAYDPLSGDVCIAIDSSGLYVVIVRATDPCGATGEDTVAITVTLNSAPEWTVVPHADTSFCLVPEQLCMQAQATDPDGETVTYRLLAGPGSMDSLTGVICFVPEAESRSYTFFIVAYDACGATTVDTAKANVHINRAPIIGSVRDTLVTQCVPEPVCFPPLTATDPDGGSVRFELLSDLGAITGNVLCFTPDTPGAALYCFTVRAVDSCGASDTTQFCAQVTLNRPPVLTVPANFSPFLCASELYCFGGISATDPDGGAVAITKVTGPGTFDQARGEVCFTPAPTGSSYKFVFTATDTCGAQDRDSVTVTILINRAPTLDVPAQVSNCVDSTICFTVGGLDPDNGDRLTIVQIGGPSGTFTPDPLVGAAPMQGQWCWAPDTEGSYAVIFQVSDSCGATAVDTTRIDVQPYCDTLCFAAALPAVCPDSSNPDNWLFQGRTQVFPVTVEVHRPVGAFDFLIGFDASALAVSSVERGEDISTWEFFTYRLLDAATECSGICPSGLVRIVAIADINNGAPIADSSQMAPGGEPREYARIIFQVSNDRTLAGQFVPVNFWWNDCGDNTFSSPDGDLYVSNTIDPDTCVGDGGQFAIEPCAAFQNGGGCIPRAADIDDRGDLNLNGFSYEIADAVLYTNYFIFGSVVFDTDPIRRESQIAASDVNADGAPLTVADLVFLIRVILGFEDPIDGGAIARVASGGTAEFSWLPEAGSVELELRADHDIGAVALELNVDGEVHDVTLAAELAERGLELRWHQTDQLVRIVIYSLSGATIPQSALPALATVHTEATVRDMRADVSDAGGRVLEAKAGAASPRPVAFELHQNFPNPFNPETEIRFTLHQEADASLRVYNLLGREVSVLVHRRRLPAGEHRQVWIARDAHGVELPSGVYMYRLEADGKVETRKMLLLR